MSSHGMSETDPIIRTKPFRQTRLGYCVLCIWLFLCLCLCILTGVSLVQPQWLEHTTKGSLGLYQVCTPDDCTQPGLSLKNSFSSWWSAGAVFAIFAVIAFVVSMLLTAFWILFREGYANEALFIAGILQFVGGFLLVMTCLLYPMGWNNKQVRALCGTASDRYNPGECRVGWTYILTLLASLDGIILGMILFWLIEREAPTTTIMQSGWSSDIDADSDEENA